MGGDDLRETVMTIRHRLPALLLLALLLAGTAALIGMEGGWTTAALWVQRWQTDLHRALAAGLRAVRTDGVGAAGTLIGVSFLYGIVHAAGPGHGKAVIAAYMLADRGRLRRGLLLAWASALMQAVTATVLVLTIVHLFGLAGRDAQPVALWLERAGYGMVAALGCAMVWSAVGRFLHRHAAPETTDHDHPHHHHDHDHHHRGGHDGCGHVPLPGPSGGSRLGEAGLVLSVGLRPCSGALLVLAFSQAVGIPMAGIVSTFVMAVGTALTVSVLAVLAVGSRSLALSLVEGTRWAGRVELALTLAGGLAVVLVGALLLAGSFQTVPAPFR